MSCLVYRCSYLQMRPRNTSPHFRMISSTVRRRTKSVLCNILLAFYCSSLGDAAGHAGAYLRPSSLRRLQDMTTSSSSVPLFFTFSFVNDATASSLESRDSQNEVVALICGSVMDQVSHQGVKWTLSHVFRPARPQN
jgi:hypothetical protein